MIGHSQPSSVTFGRASVLLLALYFACPLPAAAEEGKPAEVQFNRDIRPILSRPRRTPAAGGAALGYARRSSFFAFFNNIAEKTVGYNQAKVAEPIIKVPTHEQQAALDKLAARKAELERRRTDRAAGVDADLEKWEQEVLAAGKFADSRQADSARSQCRHPEARIRANPRLGP